MKTLTTIREVREWGDRLAGGDVGLVPTMGSLHRGHLSLVERARRENDHVVASLFVNPTQFGPLEDLARYPRDLDRDRALLEEAGCDTLFAPTVEEMYPRGSETTMEVGPIAFRLEGERRPGHFRGVATVVMKLFGIVEPDRAYFGEKDAQQLAVIRALVRDLNVRVEIVGCPIVREGDGLALSSRNSYLDAAERQAAPVLYQALRGAEELWEKGERNGEALREHMKAVLSSEPRARVDYVSVADAQTFEELDRALGSARLLVAVHLGSTRLIDSLLLGP